MDSLKQDTRCGADLLTLLLMLGVARVMAGFWFTPQYSDFGSFHYPFATLSLEGYYPFVHYWLEYPPVFPYLSLAVARVLGIFWTVGEAPHFQAYSVTLQAITGIVDVLNAWLIFHLVARRSGRDRGLFAALAFCVSFAAAFVAAGFFDGLALLTMLFGIKAWLDDRPLHAGVALGLGGAIKILPLVLLPAFVKCRRSSASLTRLGLAVGATMLAVWGIFLLADAERPLMPLRANSVRQPWETVWALIEKQYFFGALVPAPNAELAIESEVREAVEALPFFAEDGRPVTGGKRRILVRRVLSRFQPNLDVFPGMRQPLIYTLAGIAFLVLFIGSWRKVPATAADCLLPYSAFLFTLALIYSKGWSPQFVLYPVAFILMIFPTPRGALLALALMLLNFLEMPIWVYHVMPLPTAGPAMLIVLVLARTLFLAWLVWAFYRKILERDAV